MIKVTDIGGNEIFLNVDLFEKVIKAADTRIVLLNGTKIVVKDSPEEIIEKIIDFRQRCSEKQSIEITYKKDSE